MSGEPVFLGIDLGTTEVKAGLVAADGRLLALARSGYGLEPAVTDGWAEQDPGAWWSAVVGAVRGLRLAESADIGRSASTATARRWWRWTRRGEATRPAITFLDARATAEADELAAATGDARLGARRAAGRALGRAPRAGGRGRDALVPHHLGVARVPPERRGRRAAGAGPARRGPGPRRRGRRPVGSAPDGRPGAARSSARSTEAAAERARASGGHPGRRRHGRRVRELPRCRPPRARRRLRSGRLGRRVRRVLGPVARRPGRAT